MPRCQELRPDQSASPSAPEWEQAGEEPDELEGARESRTYVLDNHADPWVAHSPVRKLARNTRWLFVN